MLKLALFPRAEPLAKSVTENESPGRREFGFIHSLNLLSERVGASLTILSKSPLATGQSSLFILARTARGSACMIFLSQNNRAKKSSERQPVLPIRKSKSLLSWGSLVTQ